MKKEIGICVRKEKNFDVLQKRYDAPEVNSIVNTQVIQDIVGDVLGRGCVSGVKGQIANSY